MLLVVTLAGVSVVLAFSTGNRQGVNKSSHAGIQHGDAHKNENRDREQNGEYIQGMFLHNHSETELSKENCIADECLTTEGVTKAEGLPNKVETALDEAIADEYKALATYQAVMDKFESLHPFSMIARSEQMHIATLQSLYEKYGLQPPENSYLGNIAAPSSVGQACADAVEAKIANGQLYEEELIPAVSEYPDIRRAFQQLQSASQERYLPAFQRCQSK